MTSYMLHWLNQRTSLTPHQTALIYEGKQWTFAQLQALADTTAQRLLAHNAAAEMRVALLTASTPECVVLIHALTRIQAVFVPLNTRLSVPELNWQLHNAAVELLICDSDFADTATLLQKEHSCLQVAHVADLVSSDSCLQPPVQLKQPSDKLQDRLNLDAHFCIIHTSGTTGHPKGAVLTYNNIWWSAVGSVLNLGLMPNDRWLACLPLFHISGLSILMRSVICGIPVILQQRFEPAAVNAAIVNDGVTIISVVSVMLQRMLAERKGVPYPATFRCALLGGGPAPRSLLESCAELAVPVVQTYGLTETASQAATLAPDDTLRKLGSAGKPLFSTELEITVDGKPASDEQTGEIIVRGPTVAAGYLAPSRHELLPCVDTDGWLHTGDIGYLDAEGYLYVLDRRDDQIISGGENVYPAEVEAVLLSHPAVAEAGVTGKPDPEWGQVPVAQVVLRPGLCVSEADLLQFCRERLAGYKTPRLIMAVESLPRTASGKLQRRLMRF